MKRKHFAWLLAAVCITNVPGTHVVAEEQPSYLYEDDAWYDITEWFDGNDYNPTDEKWFHWDSENYTSADAAQSSDTDNDEVNQNSSLSSDYADNQTKGSQYGYYDNDTSDWYYDYDYGDYSSYWNDNEDETYEFATRYYDFDNDGLADAYANYFDDDNDGTYDSMAYVSFIEGKSGSDQQQSQKKASMNNAAQKSNVYRVEGNITKVKSIDTRQGKRLVAQVTSDGRMVTVDLGNADEYQNEPQAKDQLVASGAMSKVGDRDVLIATNATVNDRNHKIDRSPHKLTGKITDTLEAKLTGSNTSKHRLARVETESGKQALVDLGPANEQGVKIRTGQSIEATGVAANLNDRPVLFASKVTVDGNEQQIQRNRDLLKTDNASGNSSVDASKERNTSNSK